MIGRFFRSLYVGKITEYLFPLAIVKFDGKSKSLLKEMKRVDCQNSISIRGLEKLNKHLDRSIDRHTAWQNLALWLVKLHLSLSFFSPQGGSV